jgi:methylglutaconyl-CoA hydratase
MNQIHETPATLLSIANGVATITLNRPANRNALSEEMVNAIAGSLTAAIDDDRVRVIVLTGVGTVFCAGADLKERRTVTAGTTGETGTATTGKATTGTADGVPTFVRIFQQIQQSPKPVVAKLNGSALAGGLGLACSCDLVIAPSTAMFGFTEVRIGVAPAIISVVCLPKLRHADAAELFLTGERITAQEAFRVGLVNRCVELDQLDETTDALVAKLLLGGPLALAATKRLLTQVPLYTDQTQAFAEMAKLSGQLFGSAEAAEGMSAFSEKRSANWVPHS